MNTSITLPDSDLSALIALIDDARRDDPGEVVPWALLQGLDHLIRSDSVELTEMEWTEESLVASQYLVRGERGVVPPSKNDDTAAYFRHCRDFLPCGNPTQPADDVQAVRWSDFYTDLELRNTEAYRYYFQTIRTCLAVRLPSPPGRARRFLFMRESTRDFTDHDVMLLSLLRPHLHEIFLDAERRRTGVPKLTAREWEILQLAGEGLPNGAIGQRLFIAPATVRKHMEHIHERLGVHSRTEAAAIALPHRPQRQTPQR
jgi:DNA-binding CsgD family transcriptional regulator